MQFADVPEWPGYRINEAGIVISCRSNSGKLTTSWRVLSQSTTRDGYKQVHLHNNGNSRLRRVHTLVLRTFVGPPPDGMQGCHNNNDKNDNSIENLRWDTIQNNIKDRDASGSTSSGERNGNAKLNADGVSAIISMRATGLAFGKIAKATSISKRQVMRICKNESWKHLA